jgi:hypothetical protein
MRLLPHVLMLVLTQLVCGRPYVYFVFLLVFFDNLHVIVNVGSLLSLLLKNVYIKCNLILAFKFVFHEI